MSETDFLKLKKHDNVETNTEKFDIENYLNGNWDKINENAKKVNTDISNINSKNKEQDTNIGQLQENTETSSNKISELEKELKETQEDFYWASVRGQASGEYIHVEDSSNCRSIIGIGGNHEQETRSGKNYLNTLAKYKAGEKVTVDGITYIFNEDGSITCNGTADTDIIFNFSTLNLQKIDGTSKKLVASINGEYTYTKAVAFIAYDKNFGNTKYVNLTGSNKNYEQVLTDNVEYAIFRIVIYKDTIIKNRTLYLQILDKSISDLTYEQYGASPSPDYTSPVVAVGSNVNEFDIDTVKDGFLNEKTGEIISNNSWKCSDFIEILNKTYTFGWESSSDYFQVTVCYYDENKKFISGKSYGLRGTFNNTFEVVSNAKYMKIAYSVSVRGEVATREKIKLEKGKVATPYSKYGQGCVKVTKCNNNLFNKNDIVNKAYINSSGEIVSNDGQNYTNYISVVSNTMYTIHAENPLGAATAICFYDTNKKLLSGLNYNNVKSMSFKTPSNCDFVRASVSNINLEILQIEEGPATTYEEHEEQSYIIPTQKEMLQGDYFDFDNEEEVHTKAKLVLTGNENWKLESTGRFGIIKSDLSEIPAATSNDNDYLGNMCNSYKESTPALTWKKVQGFCVDMTSCFRIYDDKYSTNNDLEGFKTYLKSKYDAGTPVVIHYKLATPERLAFTDEQKSIAKELSNARTYKNVTNLYSTNEVSAILSLDYAKDLETLLNNVQALALNNASEGV